jgi:hypothetical protein
MLKNIKWGTLSSLPMYFYNDNKADEYLVVYYNSSGISLGEAVIYHDEEIEQYIKSSDYINLKQTGKITLTADPSWISMYEIYTYTIERI